MAGPLERLDIGILGGVEDFLIGGKERQPLADLRHGVLGDVPGMVRVHVYVLQVGQGFHVGPVHLVHQVQSDVKEVCHPGVGDSFHLETILLEHLHHFLFHLLHLEGGEAAHTEDVVTVGAHLDGEVL